MQYSNLLTRCTVTSAYAGYTKHPMLDAPIHTSCDAFSSLAPSIIGLIGPVHPSPLERQNEAFHTQVSPRWTYVRRKHPKISRMLQSAVRTPD